jgi:hypothetical protein
VEEVFGKLISILVEIQFHNDGGRDAVCWENRFVFAIARKMKVEASGLGKIAKKFRLENMFQIAARKSNFFRVNRLCA